MNGPTRRAVLGGLAAASTVGWRAAQARGAPTLSISATRVRPGARVTLDCADADGFELTFGEMARSVAAPGGRVVVEAPRGWTDDDWTPMRIVPVRGARPVAPAAEVAVFTRPPLFGG